MWAYIMIAEKLLGGGCHAAVTAKCSIPVREMVSDRCGVGDRQSPKAMSSKGMQKAQKPCKTRAGGAGENRTHRQDLKTSPRLSLQTAAGPNRIGDYFQRRHPLVEVAGLIAGTNLPNMVIWWWAKADNRLRSAWLMVRPPAVRASTATPAYRMFLRAIALPPLITPCHMFAFEEFLGRTPIRRLSANP